MSQQLTTPLNSFSARMFERKLRTRSKDLAMVIASSRAKILSGMAVRSINAKNPQKQLPISTNIECTRLE
ncbi:hypothetical protein P8452_66556 [Trifolium repens]|nr:hypothetical protein P8452_66556 [Trifolium repens]